MPHKSNRDARRHLRKTLNRIGFGDWLLLYMIARNIDRYNHGLYSEQPADFHTSSLQRSFHFPRQLHPPSWCRLLPRRGRKPGRRKSEQLIECLFFRHSPFLAGELIALDASSLFFPPSTLRPFLRSSLKDMLQVPQRNLRKTADVRSQSCVRINLQLVDPFFSNLPQRQKRSSSSRQARLGFPSLTFK